MNSVKHMLILLLRASVSLGVLGVYEGVEPVLYEAKMKEALRYDVRVRSR